MLKFYLSRVMSVLAVLALAVSFSSCKDDEKSGPDVTPIVKLTAKSATESSVTFTVAPKDAAKCAYAYVKKGAALPSAAEILSKGTAVAADKTADATIKNLDPETVYVIVAAVSNGDRTGEVASIEMTTIDDPASAPAVALKKGAEEAGSLTFTVTPTNSTACAYVCLAPGELVPEAAAILEKGTPVEAAEASVATVDGLNPNTKYVIAAASANGDKLSAVVQIEMTTGAYDLDFVGKVANADYYGDLGTGTGNYFLGVADDDDKTVFYFDLYEAVANDPDKAAIPAGVYVVDAEGTAAMNTSSAFMTLLQETDDKGNDVETYPKEGTVTVSVEGTSYKIVAVMKLEDDRVVRCSYTGAVLTSNQMDSDEGLDPIEGDVNPTFIDAAAFYWGDTYEAGTGNFMLNFGEMKLKDGYPTAPGYLMVVDISTELLKYSADMTIPEGTYTVSVRPNEGTYMSGYKVGPEGMEFPAGTYVEQVSDVANSKFGLASSGTITIAKSATGYKVDFKLNTNRGRKITATYTGAIPIENHSSGGGGSDVTSTLKEDYEMDLSHITTGQLFYYGDYYKKGTGDWLLKLSTEAEGTDGFSAEMFTPTADISAGLPLGYYNPGEDYSANTFLPGMLEDGSIYPTSYVGGYTADGKVTKFAPAKSGSINVRKSNGKYMIIIELYDDADPAHAFYSTWIGDLDIVDKTKSSGAAPRADKAALLKPGMLPMQSAAKSPAKSKKAAHANRPVQHTVKEKMAEVHKLGISR